MWLKTVSGNQTHNRVKPSSLQPSWPLEVVQIDHTPIDVLVVDEWERQPLGRPWLTLAIDVASRFVTGFQISLDRPSSLTVALALTQAVLPKEGWLSDRQPRGDPNPFCCVYVLRAHVGLGAKEVLGAAPKLAGTGPRQGYGRGGVFLSVRARRACNNVGSLGKPTREENLDAFAPRFDCKMGTALHDLTANDNG